MKREAKVEQVTKETIIKIGLDLDGNGKADIETGVGFFDHMLTLFGVHGFLDLQINAAGDLVVDAHHTVEDVGICLGKAIKSALGDCSGINRYGTAYIPMDEALVRAVVDISGRPYLALDINLPSEKVGDFDTELVEEFLRALAFNAGFTLHISVLAGKNTHHIIEAVFKALAHALAEAWQVNPRLTTVLSTKGIITSG